MVYVNWDKINKFTTWKSKNCSKVFLMIKVRSNKFNLKLLNGYMKTTLRSTIRISPIMAQISFRNLMWFGQLICCTKSTLSCLWKHNCNNYKAKQHLNMISTNQISFIVKDNTPSLITQFLANFLKHIKEILLVGLTTRT